jgi:hypothetical protein
MPEFIETYEIEAMLQAGGTYAAPCPQCQVLVEAATRAGIGQAVCAHMNEFHHRRFFGDPYTGRGC